MSQDDALSRVLLQYSLFQMVSGDDAAGDSETSGDSRTEEEALASQVRDYANRMVSDQRHILRLRLARAFLTELNLRIKTGELVANDPESWGGER